MANLDRIVDVQVSLNTTSVSVEGFSTLLCVGPHVHGLARVLTYTSASQMIDDGFEADDPLYLMVSQAFMQTPSPAQVKVGRQQVPGVTVTVGTLGAESTYTLTLSWYAADGTVASKAYTYTNSSGSVEDVLNGLASAVTGDSSAVVTASANASALTLTANDPSQPFSVGASSMLDVAIVEPTETIAETMAAVMDSDSDFYAVALTSKDSADVMAMAAWAESAEKLFGTSFGGTDVTNSEVTTDLGSQLMNGNYFRTFWMYHGVPTEYPEAALMARCFAVEPGGETWANKQLAGITADNLTETQYLAVKGKNGNTYEKFRNVSITQNGMVAAGEWIDVIRFRDWLEEEIKVDVFNLLINVDKVPYTDAGIAAIETRIRQALALGQRRGGIAPDEYDENGNLNAGYALTVPLASTISANTKGRRILSDISFTARLAGAIHVVQIAGSLTYDNLITAA